MTNNERLLSDLKLLEVWINRYVDFILCKDQIKYTSFFGMQGISSFDQLKVRYQSQTKIK
jgi:hypothetical protein